jgi:hypothetical protein
MPDHWWCWRLFHCGRSRQEVTQGTEIKSESHHRANQIRVPSPGSSIEISRLQPPQIQLKNVPFDAGQIMMIVVVVAVAVVMGVTA